MVPMGKIKKIKTVITPVVHKIES